MAKTNQQIIDAGNLIKNETAPLNNTAERIGTQFVDQQTFVKEEIIDKIVTDFSGGVGKFAGAVETAALNERTKVKEFTGSTTDWSAILAIEGYFSFIDRESSVNRPAGLPVPNEQVPEVSYDGVVINGLYGQKTIHLKIKSAKTAFIWSTADESVSEIQFKQDGYQLLSDRDKEKLTNSPANTEEQLLDLYSKVAGKSRSIEYKNGFFAFGTWHVSPDWVQIKIPINHDETGSITGTISSTFLYLLSFYKDKTPEDSGYSADTHFVGQYITGVGESGTENSVENSAIGVPWTANILVVTAMRGRPLRLIVNNELLFDSTQSFYSKPLLGKKIVWFGTSIPAGADDRKYPDKIGLITGATVINEAVGSSCVRSGSLYNATESDPNGWTGHNYWIVGQSLAGSIAEKNDFINNYQSKWKSLISDPADVISEQDATWFRNQSYENKLDKYLTDKSVDLFVFDHGFNDSNDFDEETELQFTETNIDSLDRRTFQGGMNFLINRIREYNPHARIVFIGHYANDVNANYPRAHCVAKAQQRLAEKHNIPILKLWELTSWTQMPVTTTGYWENGLWIESGGASRTIPLIETWLADKLHPASDLSGNAIDFLVKLIEPFIISQI